MISEISAVDLKKKLDGGEDFLLIDVREQDENAIARIPGSTLIPLSAFQQRAGELDDKKDHEIVIHCKLGGRSMQACQYLESLGFKKLVNLVGGIAAWSEQVDPRVPKY